MVRGVIVLICVGNGVSASTQRDILRFWKTQFSLTHRRPIPLASPSVKETTRDILERDSRL